MRKTSKTGKRRTRKLSEWNLFVMKVKKANPMLSFKEILKKASKERNKSSKKK
jgi:hypothetical protein